MVGGPAERAERGEGLPSSSNVWAVALSHRTFSGGATSPCRRGPGRSPDICSLELSVDKSVQDQIYTHS